MAIVSILHRLSGILLFLLLPVLLYMLQQSLHSLETFSDLQNAFHHGWLLKFGVWLIVCAALYHFLAGVRHLIMDMGVGETLKAARFTAVFTIVVSVILFILAGVWLW